MYIVNYQVIRYNSYFVVGVERLPGPVFSCNLNYCFIIIFMDMGNYKHCAIVSNIIMFP